MQLVAEGTYERNTTAVKGALLSIRKANPEAVIMIGAYLPTAEFIRLARQTKLGATFVSISFVGTEVFAKEVGAAGAGVVVTEVVPSPADASVAVVAKGQTALQSVTPGAKPNYVSLEGYIVGSLVVQALQKVPGEITHQAFLEAIGKSETFKMGGLDLTYGPDNNRGSSQVFLIVIQPDGTFRQVTRLTKSGS
jgi:ABC-type branched-subunit amino acid transport system substrate-binding protein